MERTEDLAFRPIDDLQVIALRHRGAGIGAVQAAMREAGIAAMPTPGHWVGEDPWIVWRSPSESILLTQHGALARAALAALRPGLYDEACAIDQSDGSIAYELRGRGLDTWLDRLLEASAVPRVPGSSARARCADIAVTVLRSEPHRAWLLADRAHTGYLVEWLDCTVAVAAPQSE